MTWRRPAERSDPERGVNETNPVPMDPPPPVDATAAQAISDVYALYDPPLWLITAADGRERGGCIATFVVRASIVREMPRMIIGVARHHHSWRLIEASGRFALHLLPIERLDLVWRFGLQSGWDADKFDGLQTRSTPLGSPRIDDALAWLDCRVESSLSSGDRSIYLAAVSDGGSRNGAGPALSVARMLDQAPPQRRAELDRLYERDGQIDAAAIDAWRAGAQDRRG